MRSCSERQAGAHCHGARGHGALQLKSFRVDSQLRLVKHPGWFRAAERPRWTRWSLPSPDGNVRAQRLKRDECDIADSVALADLAELRRTRYRVTTSPGMNIGYLAFNTKHPVLGKVEVRQALDMAIDKATLVKTVFGDAGVQAQTLMPAANWANDPSIRARPTTPTRRASCSRKPASRASASASGPCPSSATTTPTASSSPS